MRGVQTGTREENGLKLILGLLIAASGWGADAIAFGIRTGIPFGDAFDKDNRFNITGRNRFVIGPTLELRLPAGFGASFDILYRRYRFETTSGQGTMSNSGGQWEFPLMLRYRFPGIVARPFIGAGPVFQRLTGVTSLRNTNGLALGAGVDLKVPFVRLTPELRYSRRFQDTAAGPGSTLLKANNNQFDLLVGITF